MSFEDARKGDVRLDGLDFNGYLLIGFGIRDNYNKASFNTSNPISPITTSVDRYCSDLTLGDRWLRTLCSGGRRRCIRISCIMAIVCCVLSLSRKHGDLIDCSWINRHLFDHLSWNLELQSSFLLCQTRRNERLETIWD
ncbi:hypothetical protein HAPAU_32050 [Halalkalicoccus paucihalophilus]|uniref:Uncharacterized protein n=1 Tax=Halalkalicoccus paucihalophilus TaxID=1008153 RepID=A0A151AAV8_9EURY|nr:hypothetical protein HAPAU_32050 [Halalkalicoccus paucihalophilus]